MAFQFIELPNSRSANLAHPSEVTLEYLAVGEQDAAIATAYALSATPLNIIALTGIHYRHPPQVRPDGYARYYIDFKYSVEPYVLGGVFFNFDTTGGTIRVPYSAVHVGTYNVGGFVSTGGGAAGTASNPWSNLINRGEGAEIVIPALKLSYTRRSPIGVVNETYAKALASITGCMNSDTFRGFAPGELLFLGASGSDGTNAEAECTYQFLASQNQTLTIGAISGIVKYGHDIVWVEDAGAVVAGGVGGTITRVHVERMATPVNFALALGWS